MWFCQDSQVGYAYLPKVRGQDATHWRRRVLDIKSYFWGQKDEESKKPAGYNCQQASLL